MNNTHFEIYSVKKPFIPKRWHWRLRAKNGKIIAHGESYFNKEDCFAAVALVQDTNLVTPIQWLDQ